MVAGGQSGRACVHPAACRQSGNACEHSAFNCLAVPSAWRYPAHARLKRLHGVCQVPFLAGNGSDVAFLEVHPQAVKDKEAKVELAAA